MSVSAIGSISGTNSATDAYIRLQRAVDAEARAAAAKRAATARPPADETSAATRAQQASQRAAQRAQEAREAQRAQATQEAQRRIEQQVLPVAQTPQQESRPITASPSAVGGSFDVTV